MMHCKTHGDIDLLRVGCPECVVEMRNDLEFIEEIVVNLNDHVAGNTSGVVALACRQILKRIRKQP